MPQVIQQPGVIEQMIQAFEMGRRSKVQRERFQMEQDDRKLQKEMHQFEMKRLTLADKLAARKHAMSSAQEMEQFQPAPTEPPFGASQAGVTAPSFPQHQPVQVPGIEELGLSETSVQPRTLQERLAEVINQRRLQVEGEREAKKVDVPAGLGTSLGLEAGQFDPSVVTAAGTLAGQKAAAGTAEAGRSGRC